MSSAPPPDVNTALIVLLFIVLILARRTYLQIRGTRYSTGRLFGFAGFYALLFGGLAFSTLYAAVATWGSNADLLVAAYVAVPVAAALLAIPYVQRIVRFEQRNGEWYYRLSWHVPALYLGLFLARIGAEVAVFGLSGLLVTYPPPTPPSVAALVALIVVDLLFGFSLGLLFGRGIGVYRAHRELPTDAGSGPGAPLLPG